MTNFNCVDLRFERWASSFYSNSYSQNKMSNIKSSGRALIRYGKSAWKNRKGIAK